MINESRFSFSQSELALEKVVAMQKHFLAIAGVLAVIAAACPAQAQQRPQLTWSGFDQTRVPPDGWAWAKLPWTGDDRPYDQLRTRIHQEVASGSNPDRLLARYKTQAQAKATDPMAQFAWGYAVWRLQTWPQYRRKYQGLDLSDLRDALARPAFPRTYNYARLRFLHLASIGGMTMRGWAHALPPLHYLGERLLKRDPNDLDVKYEFTHILANMETPQSIQEALHLSQDMIRSHPGDPVYQAVLADVCSTAYLAFHFEKKWGDKAIAANQERLRLMPPNDPQRAAVERMIKNMELVEHMKH